MATRRYIPRHLRLSVLGSVGVLILTDIYLHTLTDD
nr:MAG TPA: hypothetical protein [Caudoviricetes sp.]